jgi:glutamine amidotransferase
MRERREPAVAIVDYGLGNLYSVQRACEHAGLAAAVTNDRRAIEAAAAVILPGVGAFGDAMAQLRRLDLIRLLRDLAQSPTPLVGICLGLQLLMDESEEFGRHEGLGIIAGDVVRLDAAGVKVPQVGWNRIAASRPWDASPLERLAPGTWMYFVHSFYVRPTDPSNTLSTTTYGATTLCSSLQRGSVFACQFHPERSGPSGLDLYRSLARRLAAPTPEDAHVVTHARP